jgi:hypothetical protein
MAALYPILTSRAATWSRRLAALAIPVIVIGVLLHRADRLDTPTLFSVLAAGFALALVAVGLAAVAFVVIWNRGALGFRHAMFGLVYALIALAPAGVALVEGTRLPILNDIATDPDDPPMFRATQRVRPPGANGLADRFDPAAIAAQRAAYGDVLGRRYTTTVTQLDRLVRSVALAEFGWRLTEAWRPVNDRDRGRLEFVARSLVFGFRDDVAIRIVRDDIGARVDVRSASRYGQHDLGANANRIRAFLTALDAAVINATGQQ